VDTFVLDQLEKCKNCQMYVQGNEVLMTKVRVFKKNYTAPASVMLNSLL
jgi:hypothetical protein